VPLNPEALRSLLDAADLSSSHPAGPTRRAAVFALLVPREHTNLLLIRRADRGDPWSNHLAFPGGHLEPTDSSALAAAYRETEEETGIPPDAITCLGELGHFQTWTKPVDVHAFVGLWNAAGPLRVNPTEVAEVLEVSWSRLVREHEAQGFAGRGVDELGLTLVYPLGGLEIWGVTARMIHCLIETASRSSG